jgi:hypothetical protein
MSSVTQNQRRAMRLHAASIACLLFATLALVELSGGIPLANASEPPIVSIVTPANGSILPMAPIQLRVEASDDSSPILYIQAAVNGVNIAFMVEPQLTATWTPPAPGRYVFTAYAVAQSGLSRQAAPVVVQVGEVSGFQLLRGPFLQSLSSTSVVVSWRTDWFGDSRVRFGTGMDLARMAAGRDHAIDHAVRLDGLQPATRYYYSIETGTMTLTEPGEQFSFETAPTSARPTRIWAIGDSGTANAAATAVRDAYLLYSGTNRSEVWLMLGDNAYGCGTDFEYQKAVFEMYPSLLRRSCVWPTIGNHDACFAATSDPLPMLGIFHLPRNGQCGGLASGTERYYSFDYANIHFICLDSETSDRRPGQPMAVWLENDLASTDKDWLIAYWHSPPYSWGTHTSDGESSLIEMRQWIVPILEQYGVDLVLCGHSHNYERTFLLNGHYGYSFSLKTNTMILNQGLGNPVLDGAYQKPAGGIGADQGTVYVVCGCSGQGGYFSYPKHPAMAVNLSGFGSMVIDVNGLRLEAKFLTDDTDVVDLFAIEKGMPPASLRPQLAIEREGRGVNLSWPTSLRTFALESRPFMQSSPWSALSPENATSTVTGRQNRVWLETGGTNRFFRLRAAP